ncbi:MAG TPA: hypothetical protein VFC86_01505 [Planctomycetota bacterium]|nr:hypothetical protein [Planctomycetota bacterium]
MGGYDLGGVGFTDIDEPANQGTLGRLIDQGDGSRVSGVLSLDDINQTFSSLPGQQFAAFLDPDGGGGPLTVSGSGIYQTNRGFSELNMPQQQPSAFDIQAAMAAVAADPNPTSQVEWDVLHRKLVSEQNQNGGLATSVGEGARGSEVGPGFVTRELYNWADESRAESFHTLMRFDPVGRTAIDPLSSRLFSQSGLSLTYQWSDDTLVDLINRPPVGGYDIGGIGFSEMDEGKYHKGKREASLSLQLMQKQAELSKMEDDLKRVNDALNRSATADQARVNQRLETLENQYQELARDRQRLQETIAALNATSIQTDRIAPRKVLNGQVTAVAAELDLVVISIGRDAGVNEGDEFTVLRGGTFVGKVTIDRVDRQWSSGRVSLKGKLEPAVGDSASSGVLATPGKSGESIPPPTPPPARKVMTITGDEVVLSGIDPARVKRGSYFVLSRDWKYVAAVEVTSVTDSTAKARILTRFRSSTIQEGDLAVRVDTFADLWSVLPDSIRKEVLSARVLSEARAKLRLLRLMKGGAR